MIKLTKKIIIIRICCVIGLLAMFAFVAWRMYGETW